MQRGKVFCVTGIDTDVGKTVATGLIARGLIEKGVKVITQKAVQTGCQHMSDDLVRHRQLMKHDLFPEDLEGITCSYLYRNPCSPHLAAGIENEQIDPAKITIATKTLQDRYEIVLLEGAGGLFVPLQEEYTLIDYFYDIGHPVILVTSSRLGSLNHTIASLEALQKRNIQLSGVVYNRHAATETYIAEDSLYMISLYLRKYGFACPLIEMYSEYFYTEQQSCLPFTTLCGS
jgi:dethiobiotin synthetase